jgi:CRP-like cAMP-binding protein
LVRDGFTLEEPCLASGMNDAASKWFIVDGTTLQTGKADARLLPLPVDFVTDEVADRGWVALTLLEDMALEPPKVRLARCLINLFEGYGQRKAAPSCSVRVSQERLGMMLSLSRQTVNELLRHLEQESIIHCQRGGVRVLDLSRLRAAARGSS